MRPRGKTGLKDIIKSGQRDSNNPLLDRVSSGIYRAITVDAADPEGRGRLAAYIPALGGSSENPIFFQYASPFGGSNGSSNYGFFAVPPDPGVTIMVFFADDSDMTAGYWFAVLQQIPNVVSGGAAGAPQVDGTGQGEGAFSGSDSSKGAVTTITQGQNPDTAIFYDENGNPVYPRGSDQSQSGATASGSQGDGLRGPGSEQRWTDADVARVEQLKTADESFGGGGRFSLTPAEMAYAKSRGYIGGGATASGAAGDGLRGGSTTGNTSTTGITSTTGNTTEGSPIPNSGRNANLAAQGTYTDPIRGQSSSTPVRDASYQTPGPSRVYGMATPGQSAITFDDGSVGDDGTVHPSQVRLTTGSGASLILDGTNDMIYMVNSSGSGWAEIGKDGNIVMYGSGSISMRAEGDFNLRADQNINLEAGAKFNVKTGGNIMFDGSGQLHLKSSGTQFLDTGGAMHLKVGANMYASTGGKMHLNGPQAAMSIGIGTSAMPDIQNLESTRVESSWQGGGSSLPTVPSHEPMMRPAPNNTGGGPIVPDPNSYTEKTINDVPAANYTGENGKLDPSNLASIGNGIQIRKDAADAWNRMAAAAKADGINLSPSSGYRSYEHQLRLWQGALRKYGTPAAARKWVAPPGNSNHGWGIAVDEGVIYNNRAPSNPHYRWLNSNAGRFNFYQRMSWEPWHWEFRG